MIIMGALGITLITLMFLEDQGKVNVNPWILKGIMYSLFIGGIIYVFWMTGSTFLLF